MAGAENAVHHPIFARVFDRLVRKADPQQAEHRLELLAGLSGRVIEVGAGNGINFPNYPSTVTEVVAVEPEAYLRKRAEEAATDARIRVTVVDGVAEALDVEDESFDAAVASLVLCSVPDQARALAEIRRILKPGGELRFYEHVLSEEPKVARLQNRVDRVWPLLGGGCHPNRDTPAAIEAAGFEMKSCRRFRFRPGPLMVPVEPHVIGVASRR
jgi:ubiquinone/menaquinone biosynthesis C-methylase UbiE